ncbi:MAG: hypothetical protein U0414_03980 [Polyangiaceae bacterium]
MSAESHTMTRVVAALAGALVLLACDGGASSSSNTDGGAGGASASSTGGFSNSTGSVGPDGCSDDTRLVYLLGSGRELVKFNPATLELTEVGKLNCPVQGGPAVPTPVPFSMAVDRTGFAFVLYDDGNLFHLDTKTAHCTSTAFVPHASTAFDRFGMGFVANSAGSHQESLFVGSYQPGDGIGKLSVGDLAIERVGYYDSISGAAEMTGTGDARLFGFFLSTPVVVAEIDKSTSKVLSKTTLPDIHIGSAWAFAFWGGDFWLFTSPNGGNSRIDRYRPNPGSPSDGATTLMVEDAGLEIVGAGVSTCAPVVPPS